MIIHTIPIPDGWSVEQAWEAIYRGDGIPEKKDEELTWANIETDDDGNFIRLLTDE